MIKIKIYKDFIGIEKDGIEKVLSHKDYVDYIFNMSKDSFIEKGERKNFEYLLYKRRYGNVIYNIFRIPLNKYMDFRFTESSSYPNNTNTRVYFRYLYFFTKYYIEGRRLDVMNIYPFISSVPYDIDSIKNIISAQTTTNTDFSFFKFSNTSPNYDMCLGYSNQHIDFEDGSDISRLIYEHVYDLYFNTIRNYDYNFSFPANMNIFNASEFAVNMNLNLKNKCKEFFYE